MSSQSSVRPVAPTSLIYDDDDDDDDVDENDDDTAPETLQPSRNTPKS